MSSSFIPEIILVIIGFVEFSTNLFHLTRKPKNKIAEYAKLQHCEIPNNLPDVHYITKAWIMLILGFTLLIASISLVHNLLPSIFTLIVVILFGLYGIIQAIIYHHYWRVYPAAIAYNIPLIILLLI